VLSVVAGELAAARLTAARLSQKDGDGVDECGTVDANSSVVCAEFLLTRSVIHPFRTSLFLQQDDKCQLT